MNDKRDFERAVDRWLDDGSDATPPKVIDAVLLAVRSTPQERGFRASGRTTFMSFLRVAAVVALAVMASTAAISLLGPGGSESDGVGSAPSPSAELIARGSFVIRDWDEVEFEAVRQGSAVIGRMEIRGGDTEADPPGFVVDLECARAAQDDLILIGGRIEEGTGELWPKGTLAAIALKRGSPVEAQVWVGSLVDLPATRTRDCLAYLDAWLTDSLPGDEWLRDDISGTVEFGP